MLKATVELVAARSAGQIVFVLVGGDAALQSVLRTAHRDVRCVGYETDPRAMARRYQAADLYLHLARADTFPSTVLEALASGTPVVATAVGGIPEQIRNWDVTRPENGTGVLVASGDADAAARAVDALLEPGDIACSLGKNAARDAHERFDVNQQIECYLDWYEAIIEDWKRHAASPH
jgi:glycosyltransferase involved in cell wall biosynthesis